MQMREDWLRMKLYEAPKQADLILPQGHERNISEDDVFFQVLEVGPMVKEVKIGNIVAVSIMSANMFRMKLPNEDFKTFATREPEVLGILRKQP